MRNTTKLTPLSEIGEFEMIDKISRNFQLKNATSHKGIGDDAAIISPDKDKQLIVTTDMLVEGVHFNLTYAPLKHLGYKAVVCNISDICAMNAVAEQITVSIAVSNRFGVESIEELYKGIKLACEHYNGDLIGGDTTSSVKGLIISVTAIGKANPEKIVYRKGAKVNDLICVSGNLGAAYAGLQLLEREKEIFKDNPNVQPKFDGYSYILERQLKPEARTDIISILDEQKIKPTAMIDISDGLSSEISQICNQSGCGCLLFEDKIPINSQTESFAREIKISSTVFALNGGEDYELLFTVPLSEFEKIKKIEGISIIGHICAKENELQFITKDNQSHLLSSLGWDSFHGQDKETEKS